MHILLISAVHVVSTTTTTATTTTTTTVDDDSGAPVDVIVDSPAEPVLPVRSPAETPPLTAAPLHRGPLFVIGFGPGRGFDTKDGCSKDGCAALSLELGTTVGERWSVVLGSAVLSDFDHHVHHAETLGVRRAMSPRTWTEVGAGVGSRRGYSDGSMQNGLTLAAQIALGYEPFVGEHHAVGVTVRMASSADVEHTAFIQVALGATWF